MKKIVANESVYVVREQLSSCHSYSTVSSKRILRLSNSVCCKFGFRLKRFLKLN